MVIDIIGIKKQRTGSDNYPPAVIAMLVAAILQMLFNLWVVATSGKGALGKATTVMGAHAFFFVFQVGKSFGNCDKGLSANIQVPPLPLLSSTSSETLTTAPETLLFPSAPVSPE